jgi:antitoxin component HigA of HigAB toxin-antitoxin module
MMGGAWYDEYLGNKNEEEIYQLALAEVKKHLNIKQEPSYHEVTIMNVRAPLIKAFHDTFL